MQTFSDFEVLIINDGSVDKSTTIIEKFIDQRIHLINQKNQGVSAARNKGIKLARGKYIALLDADDIWLENHLQSFVDSIKKYPEENVFCNNYKLQFSERNFKNTIFSNFSFEKEKIILINNLFRNNLLDSIATSSSTCIKKNLFKEKKFDENMISSEDIDLWIYLGLRLNFIFNKNVTAIYKKDILNSLSRRNNADSHLLLTKKYLNEEKGNKWLKIFMDSHRFSVIIKYKLINNGDNVKLLKSNINRNNLNYKQLLLINLPSRVLTILVRIKFFLDKKRIFISVYK